LLPKGGAGNFDRNVAEWTIHEDWTNSGSHSKTSTSVKVMDSLSIALAPPAKLLDRQ